MLSTAFHKYERELNFALKSAMRSLPDTMRSPQTFSPSPSPPLSLNDKIKLRSSFVKSVLTTEKPSRCNNS
ncbi:hypothetical protein [Tolypothrix sp. NIES-4075]|uniref:hypothetical protein n=1 Tax=Tolypothrix sp. NIES-4075 TaxID=2005459 RepID=UPI00117CFB09|nr:hypothetical protein [Tolypothrix sp. NIES-4075]